MHAYMLLRLNTHTVLTRMVHSINLSRNSSRVKLLFRCVQIYGNYLKIAVHNPFSHIWQSRRDRTSICHCPTTNWLQTANSFCLLLQVFWFCPKFVSRWTVECFGFLCKIMHIKWGDLSATTSGRQVKIKNLHNLFPWKILSLEYTLRSNNAHNQCEKVFIINSLK